MKEYKICSKCGKKVIDVPSIDPVICWICWESMDFEDIERNVVIWTAKPAYMGENQRVLTIPKNLWDAVDMDIKYKIQMIPKEENKK